MCKKIVNFHHFLLWYFLSIFLSTESEKENKSNISHHQLARKQSRNSSGMLFDMLLVESRPRTPHANYCPWVPPFLQRHQVEAENLPKKLLRSIEVDLIVFRSISNRILPYNTRHSNFIWISILNWIKLISPIHLFGGCCMYYK